MTGSSPRAQSQAAAHACLTCRARKVRCDGRAGTCSPCERLGFRCAYDDSRLSDDPGSDGNEHAGVGNGSGVNVPRRRVRQACSRCHAKKARCSGTLPKCDRCQAQGLECIYRPGRRAIGVSSTAAGADAAGVNPEAVIANPVSAFDRGSAVANAGIPMALAPAPSPRTHMTPNPDDGRDGVAMKAFDNYFRHVHHIPVFSFLHRASLMERYHAGLLDQALLLALIGITSLLTDLGSTTPEYGTRCIDEAATLVLSELEKPSVLRLQALVIIVKHRILTRRFASAFMLHATACRFATALRLNYENPNLGFLARESRRRLMWSLYMIDSSIADGQADLAIWAAPESQIHLRLPCNERNFEFALPEPTEPLQPPSPDAGGMLAPLSDDIGFLALNVRIQWIRSRILQYVVKCLSQTSPIEIARVPSLCASFVAELKAFEARLPLSFRWSESNVRLRTYSPRLCVFLMTHIIWQQCHLDLYRLFLPGLKDALSGSILEQLDAQFVAESRSRCYYHAKCLSEMFMQLLALDNGVPVTDLDLPACAYQCARILDHGKREGGAQLDGASPVVPEMANACKLIASRSAGVPACSVIVNDIGKLIDGEGVVDEGRLGSPATGIPALDQPYPPGLGMDAMDIDPAVALGTRPAVVGIPGTAAMRINTVSSQMSQSPLRTEASAAASTADGDVLVGPSKNNAFDGALEGINFGPDSFDIDWSTAFPEEWLGNEMGIGDGR